MRNRPWDTPRRPSKRCAIIETGPGPATSVLIDGGFGPQPHPSFIDLFCSAPVCRGSGEMARARTDVACASLTRLTVAPGRCVLTVPRLQDCPPQSVFEPGADGSSLALDWTNRSRTTPIFIEVLGGAPAVSASAGGRR